MLADMAAPADPSLLHAFIASARRATLATIDPRGGPRLVPLCYVAEGAASGGLILHSAIDHKPKRARDPLQLARVRDLRARPHATVLVDRWSEDWDQLAWVRLDCRAEILPADGPGDGPTQPDMARAGAIAALRAKYPQYRAQNLEERPLIRLTCSVAASWGAIEEET
jgi:PPOX class probable F420-dependent enzyme